MLEQVMGKVGDVTIGRILDGYLLGENMQGWFPDFDRQAVKAHEHWLCPTHYDSESGHFAMPVHSWLLEVGKELVLIDTCMGNHKARPGVFEMHMLASRYLERMASVGVHPHEIDYVLCTHLHADHIGWNTRLENGRWVPTFPNARYVLSNVEYATAREEATDPNTPAFLRNAFEDSIHPVVESGKAYLVDGIYELLDCLTLRPAPGHSPGHFRIELESAGALGVFAGDMLHSPVQVPFWQWSSRVCWDKALSAKSRRDLLEFCVERDALLLPGHFEAPHVGRIRSVGNDFAIDFGW
jgi:glyoxylase-like metal-dependent hydrolase (beta-lactamase superfamily II)